MLAVDLSGKRALVTGANSGIGEAIALHLAQAGADVAVNYLNHPEAADAVCDKIRALGRRAIAMQADVADPSLVGKMFALLDKEWGGIDILVNNAGIDGRPALGWQGEVADWTKVIEVNLFGAFHCCREALNRMVPQGHGVILNMSSVHEVIPWSGYSAYTASKAGLSMMTKTLAQEAAPHGVRVLALAPGAIKTAINKNVWSNPEGLADLNLKIPLGRMGETAEIAKMAAVMVSDLASYATGSTVFVDGGMTDFADFAHGG
ncbi:SDR family oxidoreductase [Devosia rhodophyticola]|uniref:SDR family oxidoreductase n=1 Tax=Devosia rhodophyticola TaxID=3026423 RepID=A0ABY7Z0C9_9HYPH|nr:SDR family oxidoreductase [Devosia rhodophyticola]WDR06480.1 SDR family oxidoreductase [Devosia rhodophyticola]